MENIIPQLPLSQAIEDFAEAKKAKRLSPNTLNDYSITFRKFQAFFPADPPLAEITARQVRGFLNSLEGLSKKTVLNHHTALSSLWHWAVNEEICSENIIRRVEPPDPETRRVKPFKRHEVVAMLDAVEHSIPYSRLGKKECTHALPNTLRDRAILMCLVDTGIRASELGNLRTKDLSGGELSVFGKGAKERVVPISIETEKAIEQYLNKERSGSAPASRLFTTREGGEMDRHAIRLLIYRVSERARVVDAHPHRFRHTFAINFLRNGGDPYSLQMILGHSTMDMVKTYLALAQADLIAAHQKASPVMCWELGNSTRSEEV